VPFVHLFCEPGAQED